MPPTRPNGLREFKEMVARFHDAGLEVILDVVYNHTAEGNELGPTLSFKGIDNAVLLSARAGQPALLQQRHRHRQHAQPASSAGDADGHRQPALLGDRHARRRIPLRPRHGSRPRASSISTSTARFLIACSQDPVLVDVKLIAEPWDCGPGGYQVGGFPPGWAEWNDKYPRRGARLLARREAPASVLASRLCALERPLQPSRPQAVGERELRHDPRRLHAERPRLRTTTSTTRPTAKTIATAARTTDRQLRRRRTDRRPGDRDASGSVRCEI